jgi:FkbM family methyltransferase
MLNFLCSAQKRRVIPWFKARGDETLRLNYNLDENSIVFDLGGFEGKWASDIFNKYACRIFVFEPVPEYFYQIRKRFQKNQKVSVFNFGLDKENRTAKLSLLGNGTSMFKRGARQIDVKLVKAADFMDEQGIDRIDLMKINIEGGEYDLLDHLISGRLSPKISNIQAQFHDFVPNARARMKKIQEELSKTHYLTYQYEFVWENWRRK